MEFDENTSPNKRTDQLYKFCPFHVKIITPTGNIIRSSQIPVPRSGHRIVYYKGNIFAFGGYSPTGGFDSNADDEEEDVNEDNRRLFRELWRFNFATKTWFYAETDGSMPFELASHAAVLAENCMLVYGGTGFPFGQSSSNSTHLCNLDTLEWLTLSAKGERPQPLYGQAIALNDRKLYVVGGTTGFNYTISVHSLDLKTEIWSRLDNKKKQLIMPSSRYRHEIAIFDNKIFVFGGGTVSESFNLKELPTFCLIEKIWSVSVTTSTSSDVYICGGHDGQKIYSDIWKINLKQLQWIKLSIELPVPLYFHAVTVSPEGQLFSFGGVTNAAPEIRTNTIYSLWLKIPSLSDMCWEAVLSYIPNIGLMDKQKLYKLGVPLKYIQQIDFFSLDKQKIKELSYDMLF